MKAKVHRPCNKPVLTAVALSLSLLLTACATAPGESVQPQTLSSQDAFAPLSGTLSSYENLYASADDSNRYMAGLLLARAYIVSNQYDRAQALLSELSGLAITPLERDEANIVAAMMKNRQGDNIEAARLLAGVNTLTLPQQPAAYYWQLNGNVQEAMYKSSGNKDYLQKAFESKRALSDLMAGDNKAKVLQNCIDLLRNYTPSELTLLMTKSTDDTDRAFYEYAIIDSTRNQSLKDSLQQSFREKYAGHPLTMLIAPEQNSQAGQSDVTADQSTAAQQYAALKEGDRVAVLLPLSGRFAQSVGEPARLGILAALQDRNMKLQVVFYDTNRLTMDAIVPQLQKDKTAFIIGPVLKPEVEALLKTGCSIPKILLNTPTEKLKSGDWYFNLGPDYEGLQAARKVRADGFAHPVVAAGNNSRAQRQTAGFKSLYQGAPVCSYQDMNDAASAMARCNFTGADAVYVAGSAQEAVQVKSALPVQNVYLTDSSFTGANSSAAESRLIGSQLGDMPWLLTDSALKDSFMANIPKASPQEQRIFAAAYDSIGFAINVNHLAANKADVLHGLSGDIQTGANGLIETTPMWISLTFPR